jgi:hypothetical protein
MLVKWTNAYNVYSTLLSHDFVYLYFYCFQTPIYQRLCQFHC